jgi:hypothetical protein
MVFGLLQVMRRYWWFAKSVLCFYNMFKLSVTSHRLGRSITGGTTNISFAASGVRNSTMNGGCMRIPTAIQTSGR